MTRRVVVTGIGAVSPLGSTWAEVQAKLKARENVVRLMDEWLDYDGLNTKLGVPVQDFRVPEHFTRKQLRSMGRVATMSVVAAERALEMQPNLSIGFIRQALPITHASSAEQFYDALIRAGVPEESDPGMA